VYGGVGLIPQSAASQSAEVSPKIVMSVNCEKQTQRIDDNN